MPFPLAQPRPSQFVVPTNNPEYSSEPPPFRTIKWAVISFALPGLAEAFSQPIPGILSIVGKAPFRLGIPHFKRIAAIVSNVISMDDHTSKGSSSTLSVRDRRYAIRYPFAADAELLDLESGARIVGVTSDISMGGCFVCTSKPLPLKTRLRANFRYKDQSVEALGVVRIVKPRIGMGIEFLDVESPYHEVLSRWIAQLQKSR